MKRFRAYKNANQTKTNQQNKIKQTNKQKKNKGKNFSRIKTSKREKIGWFWVDFRFCTREIFSKNKKVWNCPNDLIYYITESKTY